MPAPELKPCPFCRSVGAKFEHRPCSGGTELRLNCHCGVSYYGGGITEESLAKRWNAAAIPTSVNLAGWQPIATVPKDGNTKILILFDSASVEVVRLCWWNDGSMEMNGGDPDPESVGWWSAKHSVTDEQLTYMTPLAWMPMPDSTAFDPYAPKAAVTPPPQKPPLPFTVEYRSYNRITTASYESLSVALEAAVAAVDLNVDRPREIREGEKILWTDTQEGTIFSFAREHGVCGEA